MKRQYRHVIIGLLSLTIIFSSCKTNTKNETVNSEFGNIPTALIDSLKFIGQEIQQTKIDPTKDNVIRGKNGTVIYITANSLIDDKGVPISLKTVVELKENYSVADYITSNLQTVHNKDLLQTQGMIYLSAKTSDGSSVRIDKSKPIRIEFPIKEKIAQTKIFKGVRDENGNMNWGEVEEPSKLLVPFPIRTIAPNPMGECQKDFGITDDLSKWNKDYLTYANISKYENTILATREFRDRFYSYCMPDLTKIYIDNINKNMWEIDDLVVKYFIKDSTERVNYELKNPPQGINGGSPSSDQEKAHKWLIENAKESGHSIIERYKIFAAQKLTKIDPTKLVSDTTIAKTKSIKDIPDATISEMNSVFIAYDALEFGWVNVDCFYADPKSENIKILVKTNEVANIINLIIPNRRIILTGTFRDINNYCFSKLGDCDNKFPRGEKAIIVAISILNNKLHFAEKEIIIGQNETETIELKETSGKTIKSRLKNYDS